MENPYGDGEPQRCPTVITAVPGSSAWPMQEGAARCRQVWTAPRSHQMRTRSSSRSRGTTAVGGRSACCPPSALHVTLVALPPLLQGLPVTLQREAACLPHHTPRGAHLPRLPAPTAHPGHLWAASSQRPGAEFPLVRSRDRDKGTLQSPADPLSLSTAPRLLPSWLLFAMAT